MTVKYLAWVILLGALASVHPAYAERSDTIGNWNLGVSQSNNGLSCQAWTCDNGRCRGSSKIGLHLWGSAKRRAVTPLIAFNDPVPKGTKGGMRIGERTFGYSAEHDGSSDKLAPSRASDDKKVMAAMAAFAASSGAASITISNEDFGARVSLKGLDRVQAYFQKHCGIPPSR